MKTYTEKIATHIRHVGHVAKQSTPNDQTGHIDVGKRSVKST